MYGGNGFAEEGGPSYCDWREGQTLECYLDLHAGTLQFYVDSVLYSNGFKNVTGPLVPSVEIVSGATVLTGQMGL